jgi:HTH-type transcriptional regulator / antitoxin HigA
MVGKERRHLSWQRGPLAAYRSSKSYATQQGTLASWLCRAETQAASIACRPYAAKAFRTALQEIGPLSCETDPSMFVPQLQALAGAAGVARWCSCRPHRAAG